MDIVLGAHRDVCDQFDDQQNLDGGDGVLYGVLTSGPGSAGCGKISDVAPDGQPVFSHNIRPHSADDFSHRRENRQHFSGVVQPPGTHRQ